MEEKEEEVKLVCDIGLLLHHIGLSFVIFALPSFWISGEDDVSRNLALRI